MRFYVGDENSNIKSAILSPSGQGKEFNADISTIYDGMEGGKGRSVDRMVVGSGSCKRMLAVARVDGSASLYPFAAEQNESLPPPSHEWKEPRIKSSDHYIGLDLIESGAITCTSSGHLRLTSLAGPSSEQATASRTGLVPTRLCDFHVSPDQKSFAYGGDEVDLSVWDLERSLAGATPSSASPDNGSQKRKKGNNDLFHGETWRGKNVQNDSLSLRQPIHITSLTYLQQASTQLLTGTKSGYVRRYDTRAARRPVSNWEGIGKVGGVKLVQNGFHEHEVFVSDHGSHLFSLDTRNGRILHSYKGVLGAITSIAPTPSGHMASISLDRLFRLHTTFPPPAAPSATGQDQHKGATVCKEFVKSVPTVIVWDGEEEVPIRREDNGDEENMWDGMEEVDDDEGEDESDSRRKSKRGRQE